MYNIISKPKEEAAYVMQYPVGTGVIKAVRV
jgi:hypothetical protein